MSVLNSVFTRRPAPSGNRQRNRLKQAGRIGSGLRDGGYLERLENRFALAVVNAFDVRFTANDTGDIIFAANTIMTAPGDSPEAIAARNGTGPANTLNNDYWNMVYVDIDGNSSTFNSSAATLDLPEDADVLFAGLYWGGRARGADQFAAWKNVKFRGPDDGGYRDLTSLDADFSSTPQGAPTGSGAQNYQGFKDVTDLVRAQGEGTYTVANIQAYQDNNYSAGWALVVAYRAPNELARNLTVFDGFAYVTTSDPDVTIPVSGFLAPPSGPVNATLGFIAYEGDLGITGDRAFFNGGLGESQLSNATNPANNFFNSSISDRGVTVNAKNPNYVNQLGFGADLVEVDSLIANGSTSATVRLTTTQDFYYPGVITSAIELYAPKIGVTKSVEDVNGGEVIAGDVLRYTVTVANAVGALDTAVNVILDDMIPANTTYKPGSLVISTGPNSGSKTDAVDEDQGEFLFVDNAVRFQVGAGAGGGVGVPIGGTLVAGESQTVTFEVIIDPDVIEGTVIRNIASAGFAADTSGFLLGATSNSVEVVCRPSAVLSITKTDSPETVTAGGEDYTYEITVTNSGPSSAQNVVVVDDLPAGFVATAFSGPGTLPIVGTDPFTWTIGTLAKGATVALLVTYRVEAEVEPGTYRNTATATSPTDKGGPRTAFCDTDVLKNVDLSLDKVTVSPVVAGQLVSYTIAISNSGKSNVTGALVTDPFAGVLGGVTWTAVFSGGSGNTSGSGNINESIDLSAGGSVLYSVTGLLASSAFGSLVNTATVTSPFDTATDTVTDEINRSVDLTLDKVTVSPVVAGQLVSYTIAIANSGKSDVTGALVTDPFAGVLSGVTWTAVFSGGSGNTSGSGNINELIDLSAGGSVLYSVTGLLASSATGSLVNTATVTSPFDSATDTVTDAINRNVDLSLDKVTVSPVVAGQLVSYTIAIANSGKSDVTGAVVTDPFAGVLSGVTWTAVFSGGSGNTSGSGNINELIDLSAGGSVLYSVTGLLASSAAGSLVNTATVTSPFDSATDTVTDAINRNVDLSLDKLTVSPVVAGQLVSYTIAISNSGKSDVTGAVVTDPFAGVLSGVTWTAVFSGGSGNTSGSGNINESIDLSAGGSVLYSVTGLLASSAFGSLVNTATVTSPFDTATDTVRDDIDRNVDLSLDKVTVSPVVAGQLVSYTIAIANSGKSDVTGAVVTDPFAGVLSGVTWTAVFSGGSGNTSGSGNINESIDLSAGGSVLYLVTGLLASSAFGSLVNTATVTSPFDTASDTVTDPIMGRVDLDVTKTGDITYKGGGPLNFTVVVTNNGPSFASGVRVVDALPAGVVSWSWTVTYTGSGSGTADASPDSVVDSTAGIDKLINLAVLGTATFTIAALTDSEFKSDISNTATATIGQESASATWTSAYDGPINPTADVAALIIGTDDGCGIAPWVRILDPVTGTIVSQFLAYEPGFRGGVRVTSGDVDGDGIAEVIVAPGRSRIGQIRVFTPQGVELTQYRTFPFGTAFRGGVEVAVGDVDGDGDNDIIASMSTGIPMVRVFAVTPGAPDPVANVPLRSFRAFPAPYANGTMIAAGDFGTFFNGVKTSSAPDGVAEIVTGTNSGTRAWTRIWDVSVTPKVFRGAFVIAPAFRGGVTLSTARWDGDTVDDVIVGAGIGGNSIVEVYDGENGGQLARLTAFSSFVKTNARAFAAALDLTGDGIVDNLYGVKGLNGGGGARGVRQYARPTGIVSQLTSSPLLAPPLRIAPITLRVPG